MSKWKSITYVCDGRQCKLASLAVVQIEKRISNNSEATNFLHAKSRSWRPATAMSSRFAKPYGNNSDEGGRNVDRGVAHNLTNRTRMGNGRVGTCWQSKHTYATERMDLSITNVKLILLFPHFYFAYEVRV